ncbi:MAG: M56 family metallopeptidase, partial [Saprospiraceae bacterium]
KTNVITKIQETPKVIPAFKETPIGLETPVIPIAKEYNYQNELVEFSDNQMIKVEEVERTASLPIPFSIEEALLLVWFLGILFFTLKLLIGRYLIYKITIKSEPFYLPESLQDYVAKLTKKRVVLLESTVIQTPMTWGGFKPYILLPKEAKVWSEMELKTVLLHELTHIKRNDYWLHTLGLLAICLYWYHPLVWLLKKQQLLEREKACDEAVLNAGIQQQNYAQQLIDIARQLSGKSPILKEHALPMAKISQTKARVLAILKFDQQKFNFSKWKQWNWGLFYACLFPVLAAFYPAGKVMQAHFELPKLENIERFLTIKQTKDIAFPTTILTSLFNSPLTNNSEILNQETVIEDEGNLYRATNLEMLEKKHNLLNVEPSITEIRTPNPLQKTGLYGKWKVGKSEFTIWTYGEFKIIPTAPYVEVIDADGIIFIEEYIPGLFSDKINQLTIGKAPVDGRMGVKDNGKLSALISKGTPIKVWSDNTNYEQWMATKGKGLPMYLLKKQKEQVIKEVTTENKEWKKRIEGSKKWLNGFFVPEEKIIKQVKIENKRLVLDLGKVPFKRLDLPQGNLVKEEIGRTTLPENGNGGTIGNLSTNPKGIKYITVLKGDKTPALIKDFNFHLAENDFKNVKFSLRLYNIVDGEIGYAITEQPIPLTLADDQKGWIKMDLSAFNIVTKGDVLVVLTNNGFSGTKRRKKLYFSFAKKHEDYQPLLAESRKSKIWEKAFMMYLGIERMPDKVGVQEIKEEKGYFIKWKTGKSEFKIWTYGDFKIIPTAPYVEVISPDGIVIIEEYKKGLFVGVENELILTKAPYDGTHGWGYRTKTPLVELPIIPKGTPIQFWSKNRKLKNWLAEHKSTIIAELRQQKILKEVTSTNIDWWNRIKHTKQWVNYRFIAKEKIDAKPNNYFQLAVGSFAYC